MLEKVLKPNNDRRGFMDKEMDSLLFIVMSILLLLITSRIQAFIHEGGHYVFGKLTGYKFVSFRVGTYMWFKKDGKTYLTRSSLAGTGGQCLMSPPDLKNGTMPFRLYNLGGALLNLLSAFIYIPIWIATKENTTWNVFGLCFIVTGVLYFFTNAIPLRNSEIDNDGANTKNMSKNKRAVQSFWMQLKVSEADLNGVRIKDLPDEWFFIPEDEELKNTLVSSMGVFYKDKLMDEHRFNEAGEWIDHMLSVEENGILPIYKRMLIMDRVYIELLGNKSADVIDKFSSKDMTAFRVQMRRYPPMLRTEYAMYALYNKNEHKKDQMLKEFNEWISVYPYEAEAVKEKEFVEEVSRRIIEDKENAQ